MSQVLNSGVILPAAALSAAPSPKVSSKYVHVDTHKVIQMMEAEGFNVASARASNTRRADARPFVRHEIDFRHPDIPLIDGAAPRILFRNSHDRSTAATFVMGVYRFICSNGLVVGTTLGSEAVRHAGEEAASLIERAKGMAKNTSDLFHKIDHWSKIELSKSDEAEFSRLAAVLRFGDAKRYDPGQLLGVRRPEDEGRTLWRIFNRVQENALRSGLEGYTADGRRLTSRPLTNIDATFSFNRDLWDLAEEFAE